MLLYNVFTTSFFFFFLNDTAPTEIYTLSLHDALPISDGKRRALGVELTCGGEPTFNSRLHPERPEWNGEALGATKWKQGIQLARELQKRMCPGGVLLLRQGKQYPGESLPRWTLELIGRRDGAALWEERGADPWRGEPGVAQGAADAGKLGSARSLAESIAARVGLEGFLLPAYEDPC